MSTSPTDNYLTVDQVASEYSGKVKVGKLDVDSNQQTAARYGIRGIPTLLLFKDGKIVEQKVGAIGKPWLCCFAPRSIGMNCLGVSVDVTY